MDASITILGDPPFAKDALGKLRTKIGTAFPRNRTLITLPGVHATQRQAYLQYLAQQRKAAGDEPLSRQAEHEQWCSAVDLIFEDGAILIRPDPGNMDLAFEADAFLQEIVAKHSIKFLGVLDGAVRDAIKKRGEWWRITPLPKSPEEMKSMIAESRIGLGHDEVYYYSKATGVRYLTYQQFAKMASLDNADLRKQLQEIQNYSCCVNAHGCPEIAFFETGRAFSKADFSGIEFHNLDDIQLRAAFETLRDKFFKASKPELRRDDIENAEWKNAMVAALIGQDDDIVNNETLLGLSPEFFMQIEWLPGGCIADCELIFDMALEESDGENDQELNRLRDELPQKFIFNFVREYGDLEYVNIGRVVGSLSRRPIFYGRRGVYIAVLKLCGNEKEIVSVIRIQKRGVREFLDEGCSLESAMIQSEQYTEYVLDRRLACRQLGMDVPAHVTAKRISENYLLPNGKRLEIWSPYFERDYIRGIATDKLPPGRFENTEFSLRFARLLGRAAAPNLVVGRCDPRGNPLFDDGDEVLREDAQGLPCEIVVADQAGTFNDYLGDLRNFAEEYANPVKRRIAFIPSPPEFVEEYLDALCQRFCQIQAEYRKHRRAFDTLFKYRPRDESGSFAYRWEKVLARLDATDARGLVQLIRDKFFFFHSQNARTPHAPP
jgi:hypothetical protein